VSVCTRTFVIRTYKQPVDGGLPIVELEPDHQTFKRGDFERICERHKDVGFEEYSS
jgi:hypothetical protein